MLILKHIFIFFLRSLYPPQINQNIEKPRNTQHSIGVNGSRTRFLFGINSPKLVSYLVSMGPKIVFQLVSMAPDSELVF